jgi:hypothetical protein
MAWLAHILPMNQGHTPGWRRRRDFIRAHHPDHGGDPDVFVAGLHALDSERALGPDPLPRVIIVRRRPWLARLLIPAARRLGLRPGSRRVR